MKLRIEVLAPKSMRILFAHNHYQSLGGEDLAAAVEMDLLKKHGHTTDLFEVDNAQISGFSAKTRVALGTVYSPTSKGRFAEKIRSFKPDIVHIFNFFPLLSPSVHYACRDAGVPVVQKISNFRLICPSALLLRGGHACQDCVGKMIPWPGVLHRCYRDSLAGSTVVATMLAVHRLLGTWERIVDGYIARTSFSRNKLIDGGLPADKIRVIPSFAHDPGSSTNGGGRFAFFAGRLSSEKGIATLLSAWDHLKGSSISLKVAGDGPLRDQVKRRAERGGVEYVGALSRDEVQALMHQAAFLVFPSVCYENFPLAIVEAFASGLPVVASGMGAMAEIIEDRRTGLHFRPGDSEDLATKVAWAADHPAEIGRMRREARAEYLSKYTPERNHELLMQFYHRTISARDYSIG